MLLKFLVDRRHYWRAFHLARYAGAPRPRGTAADLLSDSGWEILQAEQHFTARGALLMATRARQTDTRGCAAQWTARRMETWSRPRCGLVGPVYFQGEPPELHLLQLSA